MIYPTPIKNGHIDACISMKSPNQQTSNDFKLPHTIYPLARLRFAENKNIWDRSLVTLNAFLSDPTTGLADLVSNVYSKYKYLLKLRKNLITSLEEAVSVRYEDTKLGADNEFMLTKFDPQGNILIKKVWEPELYGKRGNLAVDSNDNICCFSESPSFEARKAIHIKRITDNHWARYLNEAAETISFGIIETEMITWLNEFVVNNGLLKKRVFADKETARVVNRIVNPYGYIDSDEFDRNDQHIITIWSLLIKMWFPVIDTIIDNGGLSRLYQFFRLLITHLFENRTDDTEYFITCFERIVAKLSMIVDRNHYQISILNHPSSLNIKNDQIIIVMYLMIQLLYFNPTADNQAFECFNLGWLSLQANQFYYQSMML